ncbi:MAG: LysR family transcriptional regulator [Chloroflexi bacterium]|nr:LysR family transcriptional regulator [Chloroflexota bacterium]
MRRFLPSTIMLQAFDAAARTGSFTAAAREMNLTQGAVSKQIITLERQLGISLFERRGNAIVLTATGASYARDVRAALEIILSASLRIMANPGGGNLHLAVLPSFGTRWLMPRLPQFLKEHPGVTVNVLSRLSPFDFRDTGIHAAIHFGTPDWPGADCTYLMGEEVVPVCSPAFLARRGIRSPEDLRGAPLLHIASRPDAWPAWFRAQGLDVTECRGMTFEQLLTAAQAALVGMGAALLPRFLIERELDQGELIVVLDRPYRSNRSYYLVVPRDRASHPPAVAFRAWLLGVVAREG